MSVWLYLAVLVTVITPTTAETCISNPCENGGLCKFIYKCICPRGWSGEKCNVLEGAQVEHNFDTEFKFTDINNSLEIVTGGTSSIPRTGFRDTVHYGKVSYGASFTLSTDKTGTKENNYCIKLAYFLQGESSRLSIEQHSLNSDGAETMLWHRESKTAFGTMGDWEPLEISFFGKPQTKLLIKGETSFDGIVAVDEIKVYEGRC